jgi:hypothetical protein
MYNQIINNYLTLLIGTGRIESLWDPSSEIHKSYRLHTLEKTSKYVFSNYHIHNPKE